MKLIFYEHFLKICFFAKQYQLFLKLYCSIFCKIGKNCKYLQFLKIYFSIVILNNDFISNSRIAFRR
jgi:hypothetical protein